MRTLMFGKVWALVAVGVLALALAACNNGGEQDVDNGPSGATGAAAQAESLPLYAGPVGQAQGPGIRVTGTGAVTASPDLVLVSLGVEASASTVSEARNDAAQAIAAMIASLKAQGLEEADIRTTRFSIQPEYVWEDAITTNRTVQRLVGYRVTNTLVAKVRNLDEVGSVIDDATEAGGDAARVDSVRFTVEETSALQDQARVLAVRNAVSKADALAEELGVSRGKLWYVTEPNGYQPVVAEATFSLQADSASARTPILAGELEVQVQVQATFVIE